MWQTLHFMRPEWFLLLIPLVIVIFLLNGRASQHSQWHSVCDAHLLQHLLVDSGYKQRRWPLLLLLLAWVIATIAMAGPSWSKVTLPVYQQQDAIVLVLDQSYHMYATDLPPSRLTRARFKVADLLKQRSEGQSGLIVFAKEPYTVSPLTSDTNTIINMVPELSPELMPIQGYDVNLALLKAKDLLQQANMQQGQIVLISSGPVNPEAINTAEELSQQGYKVSVLALGTEQGAPLANPAGGLLQDRSGTIVVSQLDAKGLKQLAKAGGGKYIPFQVSNDDVHQLATLSMADKLQNQLNQSDQQTEQWLDQGRYLVFLLLPLVLIAFRRGVMEGLGL